MIRLLTLIIAILLFICPTVAAGESDYYFFNYGGGITYLLDAPFTNDDVGSNSYDFAGDDDYISVTDHADLTLSSGMSACGWVKSDSWDTGDVLIAKRAAGVTNSEWSLQMNSGKPAMYILDSSTGTGYIGRYYNTALSTGVWYYICGTWDGTAADTGIDVLVNCKVIDDTSSTGGAFVNMDNTATDVYIGRFTTSYYDGHIAKAAIWSEAISSADCLDAMKNSYSGLAAGTKTNLVAWWDMDVDADDDHNTSCGGGGCDGVAQGGVAPAAPADYPTSSWGLVNGQVLADTDGFSYIDDGSLTVVDGGAGTVGIETNKLATTTAGNYGITGVVSTAQTRSLGLSLFMTVNIDSSTPFGWSNSATLVASGWTGYELGTFFSNTGYIYSTENGTPTITANFTDDIDYIVYLVLGGYKSTGEHCNIGVDVAADCKYGGAVFVEGGVFSDATLLWKGSADATATLYPHFDAGYGATGFVDNWKIPDADLSSVLQPVALDLMTGTNGDTLESGGTHSLAVDTASSGWHKRTDECAGGAGDSVWSIDTNTAELSTVGTNCTKNATDRYIYTDQGISDFIVDAKVVCEKTVGLGGIYFRGAAETANGKNNWRYVLYGDNTNCDEYVQKYVDGSITNVYANAAGTMTDGTYYNLRIIADTQAISAYRDGVLVSALTSQSSHQTATRVGLEYGSGTIDKAFDNFGLWYRTSASQYDAVFDLY